MELPKRMIKQNGGYKLKLDKAEVEALFKPCPACSLLPNLHVQTRPAAGCTCPKQGELLTDIYRLAVPDFDRLEKVTEFPVVTRATGDFLMRLFINRDRRLSPEVMAGGAWMNSGFCSRPAPEIGPLDDFEVWLPDSLVSKAVPPQPYVPQPDRLLELFRMQRLLNQRIGVNTDNMPEDEQVKWLLQYSRCTQQEMAELVDSVPWKHWAKYQKFDQQNARVEVVDMFHFLISMAQVLGMSAEDLFDAYVKKNAVNFQRQESGYSVKDSGDSKHI